MNPPLPEQGERPYQYRFSPRNIGSDVVRGALLPGFVNLIDRVSGNNIRSGIDRLFGGSNDRMYNDEAAYMRNMLNQDARAMQPGLMERLRQSFGRDRSPTEAETFGLGEDQAPANPAWVDEWLRNGSGPLPSSRPPIPQGNRVGAGRGTTIASGDAAQGMFDSMRSSANSAQARNQARNAMINMFRGSEK